LALADGTLFPGFALGAQGYALGEAVFTTGMTGYQEVLTDPSYHGQIVTMTAPHIGNTGINPEDPESFDGLPQVAGFVFRDPSPVVSNWRSEMSLGDYLERHGIVAIAGVDTRRLTRYLRDHGSQNACIGTGDPSGLVERARAVPSMEGLDLVRRVTPKTAESFDQGFTEWNPLAQVPSNGAEPLSKSPHVVAIDFGAKRSILRLLVQSGCRVTRVPASMSAAEIEKLAPDGIFLSNGPGDPAPLDYAVTTISELLGKHPMFGICMGHLLLARALGADTYKLKFGHRGLNQPVKDLTTGRIEITTQNHGFCVNVESIGARARSTHLHLNDGTSEGLEVPDAKAFSVQYHPEAAAGPHDSLYLFNRFIQLMQP
jgi:carbamoyl-phosphate synthase small subunit